MTVTIEKGELIIRAPITESLSKSGKNLLIATTRGNIPTTAQHKGKPVTLSLNAYVSR